MLYKSFSTHGRLGTGLRRGLAMMAFAASVYLFSFGPALSLAQRGYLAPSTVATVYALIPLKMRLWYWRVWKRLDQGYDGKLLALHRWKPGNGLEN
jgi:hypothetical protein